MVPHASMNIDVPIALSLDMVLIIVGSLGMIGTGGGTATGAEGTVQDPGVGIGMTNIVEEVIRQTLTTVTIILRQKLKQRSRCLVDKMRAKQS